MRKLVITEKANAARRISTILSDGKTSSKSTGGVSVISFDKDDDQYDVVSLRGHIIELDYPSEYNDWSKSSPVDLVYAPQIKTVKVKSIVNTIKQLMKGVDEIVIATDFDREGELIGMETVKYAEADMTKVKRARFSALTKGEVEAAFHSLTLPDERLSDAAEARQIIDLAWGAVLTRLISLSSGQVGKNFMSVGRVQSPTLKLLVDRHEEIEKFVPKPYWTIKGKFGMLAFEGSHDSNPFWNKEEAENAYSKCGTATKGKITNYETTQKEEFRPAPFDTTQMQVEANKIGIPPASAMKIAEDLYTGGYISYPRTENTEYPKSLSIRGVLEKLKESDFKKEAEEILAQETITPSRGKRRTTDHPPIYPTSGATEAKLKGDKWKLYELITRRFLATVAPVAKSEITDVKIDVNGEIFSATGKKTIDEGWKKYWKKYLQFKDVHIPKLKIGDEIDIRFMSMTDEETKPPYRYNQGSLIQEMDKLNLGTKSTRHEIISKLYSRNYVQGNNMIPTASGIALTKSLEAYGGGIAEPAMTAKLESDMLKIGSGERTLDNVVSESQKMLYDASSQISECSEQIGDVIKQALYSQQHVGLCPDCGNNMSVKKSRKGNFIGCDGYPDCKRAYPMPKGAMIQTVETTCEVCGLPQLKLIRRGVPPEINCIDPKCVSNTQRSELGNCPACGNGKIRILYSKTGKRFAGCTNWPDCNQTYPLRPKGNVISAGKQCPDCGAPIVKMGAREECISVECDSRKKKS